MERTRAHLAASKMAATLPAELRRLLGTNWAQLEKDTIKLLQKLIQIDTQNMEDDGNEIEAVHLLAEIFKEAGIEYETILPQTRPGEHCGQDKG